MFAVREHVFDGAMDVGHRASPHRHHLLEGGDAPQVACRAVVDEVLGHELVGGVQVAAVDDLVEDPPHQLLGTHLASLVAWHGSSGRSHPDGKRINSEPGNRR